MDKAIELIVTWVQKNLKNPKLYATLAVLIVVIALVFPYIDANFFFYSRIEKRVGILQNLSEIDMEKVSQHPALQEEYDAIISEIEKQLRYQFPAQFLQSKPQVTFHCSNFYPVEPWPGLLHYAYHL